MITPDKVDVWEAVVTFLFFPFLITTAFIADKGWFKCTRDNNPKVLAVQRSQHWIDQETAKLQRKFGKELPPTALKLMLQTADESTKPPAKSRAQHRAGLMSGLASGKKAADKQKGSGVVFAFEKSEHMVLECAGKLRVKIMASRAPGVTVQLRYYTQEGTAKSGVRYSDVDGSLRFTANQTERYIDIPIIDNDTWEPDEHFFIHIADLQVLQGHFSTHGAESTEYQIGLDATRVTVVNDDMPGTLDFDFLEVFSKNGEDAILGINRTHGTCGPITCKYTTKDDAAVKGIDYTHVEGTINFADGQTHQSITVPIIPQTAKRFTDDRFKVVLLDPSPGVLFNKDTDGGEESAICEVVLSRTANKRFNSSKSFINQNKLRMGLKEWRENFEAVWFCNGSAADQAEANSKDWIMHCVCLFWKFLFSMIPPPCLMGGWLCFCMALIMIGVVTTLVGDLASLLGCSIGFSDDITAITLVALGTSLPDTLASKSAAQEDETADNSVGNVTGSNCVNVFLGLGLPWFLAALVWELRGPSAEWKKKKCNGCKGRATFADYLDKYKTGGYMVPASSLAFSVSVFTGCALICIMLLYVRRNLYGGELGGPKSAQYRDGAILAGLWFVYIGASIVQSTSSS